ncbi:MAG: hypothetical protein KKE42_08945 [Alphaproteobacteria bacterium]|uniref:hypothetical protein n=1 Tax=Brevundimonas sp. TaxID=1871086 RepID=UPI0017BE18F5|nr:hypothetical protein [Brevundimonas sp.]MBA3050039.1 hypothetical protein [Brevundimonas sp.]MBU3971540.1 hypothetical protein [Alphaproteobacteria bacterium]MBU3973909.1 hypothetical protein [Alphaproteobacteria bacterium]MBU4136894.1 hypothetical protein [Alphaproteobacteria bacterium]
MDNRTGKRHNAKGRSTGEVRHFGGRAKSWKFAEGFVGEPMSLLESPAYRALNFPALKILGFLKLEHVRHGGAENGRLMAPYRQLEAQGISPRKIKPALAMLEAFGIIRCTSDGERLGGRPNAAKYALAWLPTCDGSLPTDGYKRVTEAAVKAYRFELAIDAKLASRKTAAALTSEVATPTQVKAASRKSGPNAYTSEGGTADTSEGTIYILGGSHTAKAEKPLSEPLIPEGLRNRSDDPRKSCVPEGPATAAEACQ